jgi:hypothetical protein
VRRATNTPASHQTPAEVSESKIKTARSCIQGRGPTKRDDGKVEFCYSADDVRSPNWLALWTRLFPDAILQQGSDDPCIVFVEEGPTIEHTRAVRVIIDRKACKGSRLFCFRWFNEHELLLALRLDSRVLFANAAVNFPGWDSIASVMTALKADAEAKSRAHPHPE